MLFNIYLTYMYVKVLYQHQEMPAARVIWWFIGKAEKCHWINNTNHNCMAVKWGCLNAFRKMQSNASTSIKNEHSLDAHILRHCIGTRWVKMHPILLLKGVTRGQSGAYKPGTSHGGRIWKIFHNISISQSDETTAKASQHKYFESDKMYTTTLHVRHFLILPHIMYRNYTT